MSKGIIANDKDLQKAFSTINHDEICRIILQNGGLQFSEKERKDYLENIYKDIAYLAVDKCINKDGVPFTATVLENALQRIHFNVNPKKNARQQVHAAVKALIEQSNLPIERTKIQLKLIFQSQENLLELKGTNVAEDWIVEHEEGLEIRVKIDPTHYKTIYDILVKDRGKLFILEDEAYVEKNLNSMEVIANTKKSENNNSGGNNFDPSTSDNDNHLKKGEKKVKKKTKNNTQDSAEPPQKETEFSNPINLEEGKIFKRGRKRKA